MAKASMGAGLDPRALLVVRLACSAAIGAGGLALVRPEALRLPRAAWLVTGCLGAVIACLQLAYYRAVIATNVGTAVFLEYLGPTLLVILAWRARTIDFERWSIAAVGLALAGSIALVGGGGGLRLTPDALVFGVLAAVLLAAQNLLLQRALQHADRLTVFVHAMLAGAAISLAIGLPMAVIHMTWTPGLLLGSAYMVILATVVPTLLLMVAIEQMGPARAGMISTLEPVTAATTAWFVLHEQMHVEQWVGGLLILLAILLMQRSPKVPLRREGQVN